MSRLEPFIRQADRPVVCIALIVSFDAMVRPSIACALGSFGCSFVRLLDLNLINCNSCGVACTSIGITSQKHIHIHIYTHKYTFVRIYISWGPSSLLT